VGKGWDKPSDRAAERRRGYIHCAKPKGLLEDQISSKMSVNRCQSLKFIDFLEKNAALTWSHVRHLSGLPGRGVIC
jgi:hypothetical protein